MIFEDWNPADHIVDASEISADWPRFLSTDIDGPVMLWAKSPDGRLYLLDQLTETSAPDQEAGK